MEKIKLTVEQAGALKMWKEGSINLNTFIKVKTAKASMFHYEPLRDFSFDEFARLLYEPDSSEVEETCKVGDWVFVEGDNWKKLREILNIKRGFATIETYEGLKNTDIPTSALRHATLEEIKAEQERRVWAKIGREVGQFMCGDTARHVNDGSVSGLGFLNDCYKNGTLKGFYPAESFIPFGGGEE